MAEFAFLQAAEVKRETLFKMCEEMGIVPTKNLKKDQVRSLIMGADFPPEEVREVLAKVLEDERWDAEEKAYQRQRRQGDSNRGSSTSTSEDVMGRMEEKKKFKVSDFLASYKEGDDFASFLINFERVSVNNKIDQNLWVNHLLPLLPGKSTEIISRLSEEDAFVYGAVKAALMKRHNLNPEQLRKRFREAKREPNESFVDLAYRLENSLKVWLESCSSEVDVDKVKLAIAYEKFCETLPSQIRVWLSDQIKDQIPCSLEVAAEMVDSYVTRRNWKETELRIKCGTTHSPPENNSFLPRKRGDFRSRGKSDQAESRNQNSKVDIGVTNKPENSLLDRRANIRCFRCQQKGHIATRCPSNAAREVEGEPSKKLFATMMSDFCHGSREIQEVENVYVPTEDVHLKEFLFQVKLNGKEVTALRDSGATSNFVRTDLVKRESYTGHLVSVKLPIVDQVQLLPVVRVSLSGSEGEFQCEAVAADNLCFDFVLGNKSAREIKLTEVPVVTVPVKSSSLAIMTRARSRQVRQSVVPKVQTRNSAPEEIAPETISEEIQRDDPILLPIAENDFQSFLAVSKIEFKKKQLEDETLQTLILLAETDKISPVNAKVSYFFSKGILHRKFIDKSGQTTKQLVVPQEFRSKLVEMAHSVGWSGHLGFAKTKSRLLQNFYWPKIFSECEEWIRSCDTCQRVGKSTDKQKAPMVCTPLITEPFSRVIVDIVGPMPMTTKGNRFILTLICPMTKFPEAVPMPDMTSARIMEALLDIFARVGFPSEVQMDWGKSFVSNLSIAFFERMGIKVIHSSIYHPQSNSVERFHSTLGRILRAVTHENPLDWDVCLAAALFAVRSVPNASTGFTPAELLFGRNVRTPFSLVAEHWTSSVQSLPVVSYMLDLVNRLSKSHELALIHMREAQVINKRRYDKGAKETKWKVGDLAMVLVQNKENKLSMRWDGPYKITKIISATNCLVEVPRGQKLVPIIYHTNLLKQYVKRVESLNLIFSDLEQQIPDASAEVEIGEIPNFTADKGLSEPSCFDSPDLSDAENYQLREVLEGYHSVFSNKPGLCDISMPAHDLELIKEEPFTCKPYRTSPAHRKLMKEGIADMLAQGIIRPGKSQYLSPMIVVQSPGKDPRLCIDYRNLNKLTKDQVYPIPFLEERIERVGAAKFITVIDLTKGYFQTRLTERAQKYAAFICPEGTFIPNRLFFGLKNAGYYFNEIVERVLKDCEDFATHFFDDIAVISENFQDHLKHIAAVLKKLAEYGLTAKISKCKFARKSVDYLGHRIGNGTRTPTDVKVAAIEKILRPLTKKDIRIFLGITGYYRKYVPQYASITACFTDALRKKAPNTIYWTDVMEESFKRLKEILKSLPKLYQPDYSAEFLIQTDASDLGLGVILAQANAQGEEMPILYLSRKLTEREKAFSATEKECLAIIWSLQKLSCYVGGSKFIIETDHAPLTWLNSVGDKNGRLLRWSLALQPYSCRIRYKKGSLHTNADCLSRLC
jgi:hypothetical protein